jgi:hypothetical protein
MLYPSSDKAIDSDEDRSQIDSGLSVSFCQVKGIDQYLWSDKWSKRQANSDLLSLRNSVNSLKYLTKGQSAPFNLYMIYRR